MTDPIIYYYFTYFSLRSFKYRPHTDKKNVIVSFMNGVLLVVDGTVRARIHSELINRMKFGVKTDAGLTLLCCESIQNMLGCLCRRTPLLHTTSRSPLRLRPGPHTTFSGLMCSVREMASSASKENSSPGNKTSPTFSFRLENIPTHMRRWCSTERNKCDTQETGPSACSVPWN